MRFDNEIKIQTLYNNCIRDYFQKYKLKTPNFMPTQKFNKLAWINCVSTNNVTIYMSEIFDLEDKMAINIMAHEIVHYILFLQGYKRWDKHDESFVKIANQLNMQYGLNVTRNKDVLPGRSHDSFSFDRLFGKVKRLLT